MYLPKVNNTTMVSRERTSHGCALCPLKQVFLIFFPSMIHFKNRIVPLLRKNYAVLKHKKTCSSQRKLLQSDANWQNHTQSVSDSLSHSLSLHPHPDSPQPPARVGGRFAFTLKFCSCSFYMGANPGKQSTHPPCCIHNNSTTLSAWPQSTIWNNDLP